jgi:hypothetical protein
MSWRVIDLALSLFNFEEKFMSKWIIVLTCALSLTACNSMSGKPSSMGSGTSGTSGMGGMGGMSGMSGMSGSSAVDTGAQPVYPSGTPSGSSSKPEDTAPPGSSRSSGSSDSSRGSSGAGSNTIPSGAMPSGSGAGGIYDGGSSNQQR